MRQPHFRRAHASAIRNSANARHGLTLIEMLVALAVTLIIMAAVTTMFANVTNSIVGARASIETGEKIRACSDRLRADLAGMTCSPLVWQHLEGGGFFEYAEGQGTDKLPFPNPNTTAPASDYDDFGQRKLLGDADDYFSCTVRSTGAPFVGKMGTTAITSPIAEVVWFTRTLPAGSTATPTIPWRNLYRRVLLVLPELDAQSGANSYSNVDTFQVANDISARLDPTTGKVRLNSLSDLSRRECRFQHNTAFPATIKNWPNIKTLAELDTTGARAGEDIILTHVLGFDVKVWDPTAPVILNSGLALVPGDYGYSSSGTAAAFGAYVDLTYGGASMFGGQPNTLSKLTVSATSPATYDTWTNYYESVGFNGVTAAANDGLDGNSTGGVDDPTERVTAPPYPFGLRGVQIKIRTFEPDTRQVREVTIDHSFVPD